MGMGDAIGQGRAALGIELGSTRIKAVLVDEDCRVLASGSHEWENRLEGGHWTYHEDEIWSGLVSCYASLKADALQRHGVVVRRLAGLGVSAMMHGYLALGDGDELLVPFRTWRDATTAEAARELSGLFSFHIPERWSVSHVWQATLDGEPHVAGVRRLTTLAGLVHLALTGEHVLSVGDASGVFPVDPMTRTYDARMLALLDAACAERGVAWRMADLLPRIAVAGEVAGHLTPAGALLLDPTGDLEPGCPLCPPEGDAGTGMIATNSVRPRTANVSAGTSVFSMVVLDHALEDATLPEVDVVATPAGDAVAMVHSNNCTSDINSWVGLLCEFAEAVGAPVDRGEAYGLLFRKALEAGADADGVTAAPFVSGENVMGVGQGRPLLAREPGTGLSLSSLMRAQLMSAFATLAVGNERLVDQGVRIERVVAQGGIFKTPLVAQGVLAAALRAPVCVLEGAGEGGAWGQAVAASFMLHGGGRSLAEYLDECVFRGMVGVTLEPDEGDVEGFRAYLERFRRLAAAELVL